MATNAEVHLVEAIHVRTPRRVLAEHWNRAKEDAAWVHLQPAK